MKTLKPATLADRMGELKAKMAELTEQEKALREMLLASGVDEAEGKLFRVTVNHTEFKVVDYKGLIEKLEPSPQLLAAHTQIQERVTVRVAARSGK